MELLPIPKSPTSMLNATSAPTQTVSEDAFPKIVALVWKINAELKKVEKPSEVVS